MERSPFLWTKRYAKWLHFQQVNMARQHPTSSKHQSRHCSIPTVTWKNWEIWKTLEPWGKSPKISQKNNRDFSFQKISNTFLRVIWPSCCKSFSLYTDNRFKLWGTEKFITKRLITWRFSARAEVLARSTGQRFQPCLPIKYLRNGARDYLDEKRFSPVWATRAEKYHVIVRKSFSPDWKKDRHMWEIAKTTKATEKFLPRLTCNFSFSPSWSVSCNWDFFQTRSAKLNFSPGWNFPM